MSGPSPQVEWYLARDGQQFGPISDAELRKLVELNHLKSSDLIWRDGFPEWRSADILIQQRPAPQPVRPQAPAPVQSGQPGPMAPRPQASSNGGAYQQPAAQPRPQHQLQPRPAAGAAPVRVQNSVTAERTQPSQRGAGQSPMAANPRVAARGREPDRDEDDGERRSGGQRVRRAAVVAFIALMLAGAGYAVWQFLPVDKVYQVAVSVVPGKAASISAMDAAPLGDFGSSAQSVDLSLQRSDLWRLLKRDFPDWYQARLQEAGELARANKDEGAIAEQMAKALVALRRQNAEHALSAGVPRLKALAATFAKTVSKLRTVSVDACYGFISRGEASTEVVKLMQSPQHTALVQGMVLSVFESIAEGRRTPRVYPPPRQTDYAALTAELTQRGWTAEDMQLFSDERLLAKAPPERVCMMVQQWFEAQLAMKDPDAQLRLLVDALKPVVAG